MEVSSWKGIGVQHDRNFPPENLTVFYLLALRKAEGLGLSLPVMKKRILNSSIYRGQRFSCDLTCKELSIGNIMQFEKIAWLCEEGSHGTTWGQ